MIFVCKCVSNFAKFRPQNHQIFTEFARKTNCQVLADSRADSGGPAQYVAFLASNCARPAEALRDLSARRDAVWKFKSLEGMEI